MSTEGAESVAEFSAYDCSVVVATDAGVRPDSLLFGMPPTYTMRAPRGASKPVARVEVRRDGSGWWMVRVNGEPVAERLDPGGAIRYAQSQVEIAVAEWARDLVFVHAGCVIVDGRAVVLPGRSMSGKSTLTHELVRAGAGYFSDEYAIVDRAGRVQPYARPLHRRAGIGGYQLHGLDQLGVPEPEAAVPVGAVLALSWEPDTTGLDVRPISRGRSVLALLDNTVCARSRPVEALEFLTAMVREAKAFEGRRGEGVVAAQQILELLSD